MIKYTQHVFTELLAEDEIGRRIRVDGRSAPGEDIPGLHYLGVSRPARPFTTTVYDLAAHTK